MTAYSNIPRPYVKVRADFYPNGSLVPLKFKTSDDQVFLIDKILKVQKGAQYGTGIQGLRYTIRVGDYTLYLLYDSVRWWLETADNPFTT